MMAWKDVGRLAIAGALVTGAHAQTQAQWPAPPPQIYQQLVSEGLEEEEFGNAVALNAQWAVIGAYADDDDDVGDPNDEQRGAAYVFERNGNQWAYHSTLHASDRANCVPTPTQPVCDKFGWAVDFSGDWIVVGCERNANNPAQPGNKQGAAYMFQYDATHDTWGAGSGLIRTETAKLVASAPQHNAWFGRSVRLKGDRVLVGAYQRNEGVPNAGRVYSFNLVAGEWGQPGPRGRVENKSFTADPVQAQARFGKWIDFVEHANGDIAVIGAHLETYNTNVDEAGRVYVFQRNSTGWDQVDEFFAPVPAEGDHFGKTVAISDDATTIVASSYRYDKDGTPGCNSGQVFVYDYNPSNHTHSGPVTIEPSALDCGDRFGAFFSLSYPRLVIGSIGDDEGANDAGKAYYYRRTASGWVLQLELKINQAGAEYGKGVDLWGRRLLVGAQKYDLGSLTDVGAAYFSIIPQ